MNGAHKNTFLGTPCLFENCSWFLIRMMNVLIAKLPIDTQPELTDPG